MSKERQMDFPLAEKATRIARGEMAAPPFDFKDNPEDWPRIEISIEGLLKRMTGPSSDEYVASLVADARSGSPYERRAAMLRLKKLSLLEKGELDKHWIERHGTIYADHEGDAYSSRFGPSHIEDAPDLSEVPAYIEPGNQKAGTWTARKLDELAVRKSQNESVVKSKPVSEVFKPVSAASKLTNGS